MLLHPLLRAQSIILQAAHILRVQDGLAEEVLWLLSLLSPEGGVVHKIGRCDLDAAQLLRGHATGKLRPRDGVEYYVTLSSANPVVMWKARLEAAKLIVRTPLVDMGDMARSWRMEFLEMRNATAVEEFERWSCVAILAWWNGDLEAASSVAKGQCQRAAVAVREDARCRLGLDENSVEVWMAMLREIK